ncbi:fibronectin type III domain-containing protein [Staphylococcus nepalensis]|uniref:fibronectin type III domain-containing protein n=1 Tax=Staphylococcus nepalensis TaxID=214473 RepID=UPI000E006A93|nr:fibronectin type III domain-containing protein [Staphylococcus nepalensis]SUM66755.1 major tail protein [Staphylococcus nepalensis]SUM94692.1 major tail protein [Staphylococcus nepalensis]
MADVLKVYQGENVVGTAERAEDGTASVTIDGLEAGTEYAAGTYQVAFSNAAGESAKVDVPSFTTKESAPAEPQNVTTETTEDSADVSAE